MKKITEQMTPLVEVRGSEMGIPCLDTLLIKDESKQLYGTFKDRKSREALTRATQMGARGVMAITSGNYGYSLSQYLQGSGIECILFVAETIPQEIVHKLHENAKVISLDLEHGLLRQEMMKEIAERTPEFRGARLIDATNNYDEAYLEIFKEIERSLEMVGKKADYVIVPVGSGELLSAALRYYHLEETRVIGVTTDDPRTDARMLYAKYRPMMDRVIALEDPKKYQIIFAPEAQIGDVQSRLRGVVNCEPSAAAAFVALYHRKFLPQETVVVVNTGDGRKNFHE